MAQGRSTQLISMIKWIRASRLSIKNCLSASACGGESARQGRGSPRGGAVSYERVLCSKLIRSVRQCAAGGHLEALMTLARLGACLSLEGCVASNTSAAPVPTPQANRTVARIVAARKVAREQERESERNRERERASGSGRERERERA